MVIEMNLEVLVDEIINSSERVTFFDIELDLLRNVLKCISNKTTVTNIMIDYFQENNQLLYVFLMDEDRYIILCVILSKLEIPSISEIHPESMIFEYELKNQFGFNIHNIPKQEVVRGGRKTNYSIDNYETRISVYWFNSQED